MSLDFVSSFRSSIGMEWELQIINPDNGQLYPAAPEVLAQVKHAYPGSRNVLPEMLLNTIELITRPRQKIKECLSDLRAGLEMLQPILSTHGLALMGGGSHPFVDPSTQAITQTERYQELVDRTQYWGKQMLLFGTHVHIGIDNRQKVLPILAFLNAWLGPIEALYAASPFWSGIDTGYADNRTMMFQQLPTAGQPQQFETWEELESFTQDLLRVGAIRQYNEIRWEIRPALHLGTIEVRVPDSATNLEEVAAIGALIQCLVETASTWLDKGKTLPKLQPWLVSENRWRAARYGIEAPFIIPDDCAIVPADLRTDLPKVLRLLQPAARRLDCVKELAINLEILTHGASYQRQREIYRQTNDLLEVVNFCRDELDHHQPLSPRSWLAKKHQLSSKQTN